MRLTILGSGTMMPTRSRSPAGYLIEAGDTRVLLDCGHGTLARLVQRGIDPHAIAAVGISHFHTDHFGDVHPLIHARWVDDVHHERPHRPLTFIGPPTLERRLRALREVFWPEPGESYPLSIREGDAEVTVGPLTILPFPVTHVLWFPSIGFRVTEGARSLVYTGDFARVENAVVEKFFRDADVLLAEAGTLRAQGTHMTPPGAVALARQAGIPRLVLTHVSEDRLAAVRRAVAGEHSVTVAEDGMVIGI